MVSGAANHPAAYHHAPHSLLPSKYTIRASPHSRLRRASEKESKCGTADVRRTDMSDSPFLHPNFFLRASNSIFFVFSTLTSCPLAFWSVLKRLTVVHGVREENDPLALVVGELDLLELAVLDEGALEGAGCQRSCCAAEDGEMRERQRAGHEHANGAERAEARSRPSERREAL